VLIENPTLDIIRFGSFLDSGPYLFMDLRGWYTHVIILVWEYN
jgi:hypothetical protein